MKTLVGIGEILWDVFGDKKTPGGAPANFAYHAACAGAEAFAVSAVGNDALGDGLIREFSDKALTMLLRRTPEPTGTVRISLDENGVANYVFPQNVAWDNLEFSEELARLAAGTDAVCFGSLAQRSRRSRETIRAFVNAVPEKSLKIFDANLRQDFFDDGILLDSLAQANLLKINEDELEIFKKLLGVPAGETRGGFAGKLFSRFKNLRWLVLTLGADGSEIRTSDGKISKLGASKTVPVVDTVGAGDSFTAAFAVSLLDGATLEKAHENAARTAEFVCSRKGAMPDYSDFKKRETPVALTIAGSDSGGGAGIQADLLTFAANGVFGTSAVSALTAQNPDGVSGVFPVPAKFVREQAEQVAKFFKIRAAKTGMLPNAEIIGAAADFFENHPEIELTLDPVMIATSGAKLIDENAVAALRERLIPLAALVTPNLDEAEVLAGEKFAWREDPEPDSGKIAASAETLAKKLRVPVLLKGGHAKGGKIFDVLAFPDGAGTEICVQTRIAGTNTHGSGCTLSAAIAARLALAGARKNLSPRERLAGCVREAENYIHQGISKPLTVSGTDFIAHLRNL